MSRFKEYNANKRMSDAQIEAEYEAYKLTHGYHLATMEANEAQAKAAAAAQMVPSPTNKYTQRSNFRRKKSVVDVEGVSKAVGDASNSNNAAAVVVKTSSTDDLMMLTDPNAVTSNTNTNAAASRSNSPSLQRERELAHKLKAIKGKGFKANKFQYKPYKYPDDINVNPMDWLLSDEYVT